MRIDAGTSIVRRTRGGRATDDSTHHPISECEMDMTETAINGADRARNLGPADRIPPGEGRSYRLEGVEIAVFRTRAGEIFAAQATCPHAGGPLADGMIGDGRVICPLHGHAFDLRTGESLRAGCPAIRVFSATLSELGEILVEAAESQP